MLVAGGAGVDGGVDGGVDAGVDGGVDVGGVGSIKKRVMQAIFVGFVLAGTLAVAEMWTEVADLRVHGLHATAKVVGVIGSRPKEALLVLPGGQEATTDVGFPGVIPHEGDRMKVTYDPADPTILDQGWGVDYGGPVFFTLLESAGILVILRWVISKITHRPLVPDALGAWFNRGFRRSRVPPPPAPPRFEPGTVRKTQERAPAPIAPHAIAAAVGGGRACRRWPCLSAVAVPVGGGRARRP